MKEVSYTLHIDPAEEGGYAAFFPALPGCQTQGETVEEIISMAKDALSCYIQSLQAHGEPIPTETTKPQSIGFDLPLKLAIT